MGVNKLWLRAENTTLTATTTAVAAAAAAEVDKITF